MGRILRSTLVAIAVILCVGGSTASAYTSTEIIPIINETTTGATNLSEGLTDSSSTEQTRTVIAQMATLYETGASKISALTPSGDAQAAIQNKLVSQMTAVKNDLNQMLAAQDTASYNAAYQTYGTDIDAMNATIAENNESMNLSTTDYAPLLWTLTIFFGLISLGLLIASQVGNKLLESDMMQNKLQFELFKASLWPSIGSLISLVWYSLTPPGGTYFLLWGPIAFGGFYFIKQYASYSGQKKQLRKLRADETRKIKSIVSDME